jgi:hypothetical protein
LRYLLLYERAHVADTAAAKAHITIKRLKKESCLTPSVTAADAPHATAATLDASGDVDKSSDPIGSSVNTGESDKEVMN